MMVVRSVWRFELDSTPLARLDVPYSLLDIEDIQSANRLSKDEVSSSMKGQYDDLPFTSW